MATMRNGLDTWLKQECVNNADIITNAIRDVGVATRRWVDNDETHVILELDSLQSELGRLPYTNDQIIAIIQLRDKLAGMDNDNEHFGEAMKTFNEIEDRLYRHLLETTVECQCGKSKPSSVPGYYVGQKVIVANTHEEIDGETVTIKSIVGRLIEVQRHGKPNTIILRWYNLSPIPEKE